MAGPGFNITDYLFWHVYLPIRNRYSDFRNGIQDLTVDGISASFEEAKDFGGDVVRRSLRRERDVLTDLIVDELGVDETFLDVGANIGLYSCFAARKASRGRVIAIEPYPPNATQLQRNLGLNALPSSFRIERVALSDTGGSIGFMSPEAGSVGTETASMDSDATGFRVESVTGDVLFEREGYPDPEVVKVDVEGAELEALDGMANLLSEPRCRVVYCEVHREGADEHPIDAVRDRLTEFGFDTDNQWESPGGSAVIVKAGRHDSGSA